VLLAELVLPDAAPAATVPDAFDADNEALLKPAIVLPPPVVAVAEVCKPFPRLLVGPFVSPFATRVEASRDFNALIIDPTSIVTPP
jgi:hypothetical protein